MSHVYRPRTQVELRLTQSKHREISRLTGIPLAQVIKHSSGIMARSMFETIKDMQKNIYKYVPKATGQLRDSLSKQLHNSTISNNWLQMKLGTYVHYMKYVANMKSGKLRHPKHIRQKFSIYQRNSKHGKKGSAKRNPGQWRYVNYYGGKRWVRLDDPKAQTNFYSQLVLYMRTQLQKNVAAEIKDTFKAGERKPWTDRFKVKRK